MGGAYRYAFGVTLSLNHSLTDEECAHFIRLCKKAEYYGVVLELDENGRKHAHAALLYQTARKACNVKTGTFLKNKLLLEAGADGPNALKVKELYSDAFIANYMQKDGLLSSTNFPDSFEDLKYYFPDTAVVKTANPEFERWERMYKEEKGPIPMTRESAHTFFKYHFNVKRDLKIVADKKKLNERVNALLAFVNGDVSIDPEPSAGKKRGRASTPHKECGCMFCTSGSPDECLRKPK